MSAVHRVHRPGPAVLAGDVEPLEVGADFRGERLALLVGQVGDHHLRALLRHAPRGRAAEAPRAAGHQRHLVRHARHRVLPDHFLSSL